MPKNKGGNKYKRGKKSLNNTNNTIVFRENNQEYALVTKMCGGSRCEVFFPDNTKKLGIIRGNLRRKRSWIYTGDLVLVGIRDYELDKCDIIHKYTQNHIQILKKSDELPSIYTKYHNNGNIIPGIDVVETSTFEFVNDDDDDNVIDNNNKLNKVENETSNNEKPKNEEDGLDFIIDWNNI